MMLLDQGGGHHTAVVVVLGHHRGEACGRQVPEQFEMVDGAWCNGWATVNMRVDSTFQKAIDALLDGNGFARLLCHRIVSGVECLHGHARHAGARTG